MDRLEEYTAKLLWYYDKKGIRCFTAECIIYVHEFEAKSTAHTLTHMGVLSSGSQTRPTFYNSEIQGGQEVFQYTQTLHVPCTGRAGNGCMCVKEKRGRASLHGHTHPGTDTRGTSSPQNTRADVNAWICVTVPTGLFAPSNFKIS